MFGHRLTMILAMTVGILSPLSAAKEKTYQVAKENDVEVVGAPKVPPKSKFKDGGFLVEGFVSQDVYMYDIATRNSFPVKGKPEPNRIHVRFAEDLDDWVFVLSDSYGRFSDPMEAFVTGTVVTGDLLGALHSNRYEFEEGARWLPTTKERVYKIVVLDSHPRYKVVSFKAATMVGVGMPTGDKAVDLSRLNPFFYRLAF